MRGQVILTKFIAISYRIPGNFNFGLFLQIVIIHRTRLN